MVPAVAIRSPQSEEFSRALITAIHEASPDGMLVVDRNDVVVSHNRRFLELWGISVRDVLGCEADSLVGSLDAPLRDIVVGRVKDPDRFMARVRQLYADKQQADHSEIALADGRTFERDSQALWSESGDYLGRVWFFRDITTRKQYESELRALAEKDALTGIPNRRYFFSRAAEELARTRRTGAPVSVVMLDVDHFKRINDRYGHETGDHVLRDIAHVLSAQLRSIDVLARTGGEEFAVLLPETAAAGARLLAERVRVAVEAHAFRMPDRQRVTLSAGVAQVDPSDGSVQLALTRADAALYHAKAAGRNCTCVSDAVP